MIEPVAVHLIVSTVVEMNHQRDLRLNGTACPDTGTDKSCNIVIIRL